jgi:hypothetical protein
MEGHNPTRDITGRVPLVSEVLDRLVASEGGARRSALFQAALQVCTEELRRVKKGEPPASLGVLVERARVVLTTPGGAPSHRAAPPTAEDLAPLLDETRLPPRRERTVPQPQAPLQRPEPAATKGGRSQADPSEEPFGVGDEAPGPPRFASEPWPPPPPQDGTFEALFPVVDEGSRRAPTDKHRRSSHFGVVTALLVAGLVIAGGAAIWYYVLGPANRPGAGAASTAVEPIPPLQQRIASSAAPEETPTNPAPTSTPPATFSNATAGGATETAGHATAEAVAVAPTPTEPVIATPRAGLVSSTVPRRSFEAARGRAATAASQDRAAPMVSPDWAGREATYVVHFSSYRERGKAVADAARIAAQYGHPTYVARVDLGAEGLWYRVVLGGFATADEAFAFHAEMLARHVPDVAQVYHLMAPK